MKRLSYLSIFLLFILISCIEKPINQSEKETNSKVLIVKDCSGSYLRINNNDYYICNIEKIKKIPNGTTIFVSYEIIEQCEPSDLIVCMLYHHNIGNVNILKIEK